jgi:hypothetical protein
VSQFSVSLPNTSRASKAATSNESIGYLSVLALHSPRAEVEFIDHVEHPHGGIGVRHLVVGGFLEEVQIEGVAMTVFPFAGILSSLHSHEHHKY